MTLFSILNMAPNAAFAILCILGEILYKNVQGGQCVNPLENLRKNKTLDIQNLLEILNTSHWTYVEANNTRKKTLELCFLTVCFDVNCSCVNATTNIKVGLRLGDTSLHCKILNTRMNEAKNELEKQNATQKTDCRFKPLQLTVAFILGTVFGCLINIFTILFCRNRQSKKQIDSLEDIQLYSKFVGETSAYSEISERIQHGHELGANTGEYLEPIPKNTILQKASKSLADQDENRENNAYFTLTLDRRHADGDGYHHLKPNNGRIPTSPIHKDNDSLYHTMTSAESEITQVDNEHAENPVILEKHQVDGCCTQSSDVESKGVQGKSLQNERPYSMCINVRDITGNDEIDNEMHERNENTNTENTYFVLEKQNV